jgi:beta-lactamase regulating signal transducer with metallopeptidase domain
MLLNNSLAAMSTWTTYLIQVAFAYLVIWGLCLFLQNPRTRLRMWGGFLFAALAYWIFLLIPRSASGVTTTAASVVPTAAQHLPLGWSWAISHSLAARVSAASGSALILYAGILLLLVIQLAIKSWSLRRFLHDGCDAPGEILSLFEDLCHDLDVPRGQLMLLPGLRSPATAGWWRPVVLLPAELVADLDETQLANILRHELIHIRRHDYLWDRLLALACRIVFFHPVMWLAHRRLRWERELACDDAVVQHCDERRVQYAECLTTLARWWFLADRNSPGAIGFASSASLLGTRVRALLVKPVSYSLHQRAGRAVLIVLVLGVSTLSLPGMRLSFYWTQPQALTTLDSASQGSRFFRVPKSTRRPKSLPSTPSSTVRTTDQASRLATQIAPGELSLIEKPAMPLFTGAEQRSAPDDISGASGDGVSASAPRASGGGGLGLPQPAARKPSWTDTAADAITTGVAIIRGRTSVPTGTAGGTGGSGGGGSGGGSSGGEGPDHFTAPN